LLYSKLFLLFFKKKNKKNFQSNHIADKKTFSSKFWDFGGASPGNHAAQIPFPARPEIGFILPYLGQNRILNRKV